MANTPSVYLTILHNWSVAREEWLKMLMCCSTFDVHASGSVGETGSPGIGRASETALRAVQSNRQADRIAKSGHSYAEQKAFKMTYWRGLSETDSA